MSLAVRLHRPGVASQGLSISNTSATNSVQIRVRGNATVVDVKRAIIRATTGSFVPDSLIINGRRVMSSLGAFSLVDGAIISAHAAPDYGTPFTASVKFRVYPHKTVFLLAGKKDKVETLLWRLYRDHGVPPSTVTLWSGLKDTGDGWESGTKLESDDHLNKCRSRMNHSDADENMLEISVHRASPKDKHTSKHLSRLEAVKQLFHAFISRTEAYDLPHPVGLVLFGTTTTASSLIDSLLRNDFLGIALR